MIIMAKIPRLVQISENLRYNMFYAQVLQSQFYKGLSFCSIGTGYTK